MRNPLKIMASASAALLAACVATSPAGEGSKTESGETRDPSVILSVGEKAPAFEAKDELGRTIRLEDYRGKSNVVLIFYPGDDTPGCTKQLCAARDDFGKYQALDAVVFGVNPAGQESKQAFSEKYDFPFPLLADTEGTLVRDYGCRGIGGITTRTVYAIDKDGVIVFAERGMPSSETILASLGG